MTNIQLAIFVEKYQVLLGNAIAQVRDDLPQELILKKKDIMNQDVEEMPVLAPLYEILSLLDDDVEILKKHGENSA